MAGKEEGQRSEVSSTSSSSSQGDGSSVCLAPPSWNRLIPLRSRDDTRRFLRAILNNFVDTVDLEKPGLLEDLMAVRVLTERDAESLAAEHLYPTTSEKARHLWSILFRINFKVFVEKALPILVQHYWYIIPERFWLPGDAPPSQHTLGAGSSHSSGDTPPCLRCAIQRRIRPTDLADLLMAAGLITSKTYMEVIQGYRKSSTDWAKLFAALKHPKCRDMPSLVSKLQRMVTRHSLPVPIDFPHLLTQGFPCSCPVSKNKTGYHRPGASNLSSCDSSLPSLLSLPVSSVSQNCQHASSVSEDCQYASSSFLPSASSEDGDTVSSLCSEYIETTPEQVVSVSTQTVPEKEVRSHLNQDEEETKLETFLAEADKRELEKALCQLVPEILLKMGKKSEQAETVINVDKAAENGDRQRPGTETDTEALIHNDVSAGLCARLGSCTSRLCGRYTKCGMCLSDTGACLKEFWMILRVLLAGLGVLLVGLGALCVCLILFGLVVSPIILIIVGSELDNDDCFFLGFLLLGLQVLILCKSGDK